MAYMGVIYRDNGKENGNYYIIINRIYIGVIWVVVKIMVPSWVP